MSRMPVVVSSAAAPAIVVAGAGRSAPATPLQFTLRELSGSLGDLGTFLPLAVALSLTCGMDLGLIFIFAGVMNIATGIWFRQPIPVQPMKAIAAVAVAEGLSAGAISAAGLFMGVAVFALALVGGIDLIAGRIPRSIVRGIQAGVGIKLAMTGLEWILALPTTGWDSWIVALAVGGLVLIFIDRRVPILLIIFAGGFALLWLEHPSIHRTFSLQLPALSVALPTGQEWMTGLSRGAVPQLPLTILNSVVAVCALSGDYFPGRGIAPRRMALSVGMMNLVCVPFGGMPMCHGAGGLAAQHRFGARTGGSVVMLGGLKVLAGLVLGGALLAALPEYPRAILGVMIIVAGMTLARVARDALRGSSACVVVPMVAAILMFNTLTGFIVGCAAAAAVAGVQRVRHTKMARE